MCNFLSGIVLKNGDVITSEHTDSHNLIALAAGLVERKLPHDMPWVKVEYISDNILDIDTYELHLDDTDTPDWFDDAMREVVTAKMHRIAAKCILLEGEIPILLGGKWVLGGTVNVKHAHHANIHSLWGNSQVGELQGNSQVGVLRENSQVGELWGNSQVGELWENSQVGVLWENSHVGVLWGNSQVVKDNRMK